MNKNLLKDHQVRELTNHVKYSIETALKGYKLPQCFREIVSCAIQSYLIKENIWKPHAYNEASESPAPKERIS